ncbi:MAG: sodium:solute symporter family protein, partial [Acidobacteria bacterium]|nr:sodium:solute symporter family protein [Acidobacteriota bacterium]
LAGCATYGGLLVAGHAQVWNVHAGVVGLAVNVAICAALTRLSGAAGAGSERAGWPARGARAAG